MASIYRPSYTVEQNGKKLRRKSPRWHISYRDADGVRRRVAGFKDKTATTQLAAELEKTAELARAGVVDRFAAHRRAPLAEHLSDFKTNLLDKGNTAKHANLVHKRAEAVVKACGCVRIGDVSASRVQSYLAQRRRSGLSIQTSNFYLQAAKQFFGWLVADRRTDDNPLAHLKGQNVKLDRRHDRRALELEELQRLIEATVAGPQHHRMTGPDRAMLYKMAVSTGLRANELATLTWASLDFEGPEPSVTVLAGYSKHRREDLVYLPLELAQDLAEWRIQRQDAGDADKVFATFDPKRGAKMIRKDLELAGIPYKDSSGKVADFHSLRHTCATLLVKAGVDPKVVQLFVRHSTIGLTMDRYTHMRVADQRGALKALPTLPGIYSGDPGKQDDLIARKTGTDDLPMESPKSACAILARAASISMPEQSSAGTEGALEKVDEHEFGENCKVLGKDSLDTSGHDLTPSFPNGGRGIRTPGTTSVQRFSRPSPSATRSSLRPQQVTL